MALFIPLILPAFLVGPFMPEAWKGIIVQTVAQSGITNLLLILVLLLLLFDIITMVIALRRFQRKLLIFE